MNTQVNLRIPGALLKRITKEAKMRGYSTIQAFILETMREEVMDLSPKERHALAKALKAQDRGPNGTEKELFAALRARSEGFRVSDRKGKERSGGTVDGVHARVRPAIPRTA